MDTEAIWSPDLSRYPGPAYLGIADALAEDIQAGRLAPGTRLPTHRDLADALGVTVGTITRAYGEAQRRNLISGEVGRGTFVGGQRSDTPYPVPVEPGLIDLSLNRAIQGLTGAELADALRRLAGTGELDPLLDYQPDAGIARHRSAAAAWLVSRGLKASPERVVLTHGAQHAIVTVFSALAHPQDTVLTEALTYPGAKAAARELHLRLEGVSMDDQGLRPEALDRAFRATGAKILYTIPTLQNPTAGVMPLKRRAAIIEVCRRHDATIVEDGVYNFLVEDAPSPLATLAPERTYFLDGTSKLMGGGIRVGMVLSPPGEPVQQAAQRVASHVRAASGIVPPLMAELASRWYTDGTAEHLVTSQRAEASRRQGLARKLFGNLPYPSAPYSPIIWLPLPESWRMEDFAFHARNRGVAVTPGSVFAVGREPAPNAVRVCLGANREDRLTQGLAILADLLRRTPDAWVSGA